MKPLERKIDSLENGWFRIQYNAVNNVWGKSSRPFIVKYCEICDKAWEWLSQGKKTEYYNREDLPFYGLRKETCRGCK
jgi:hypothetical protein